MNQKSTFAVAVALVGGVGLSVAAPWNPKTGSMDPMPIVASQKSKSINRTADMETKKSNLHMDVAGIKHVKVNVQLGEIEVTTNASSNFDAEITKGVSRPIGDKERQWLDNPWLKARREGDTLVIYEDKNLRPDIFHRESKSNDHRQIDLTVKIQIPRDLDVDVTVDAGDVKVDGDYRSLNTKISAGQLSLDHFRATDSIKVDLDAGQVDAKLTESPRGNSEIRVAVGQVNLDLKGNANVNAKTSIGSISYTGDSKNSQKGLGSKQKLQFGSGGSNFTVEVDAGNINFGNGKVTKAELEKIESDSQDLWIPDIDLKLDLDDDQEKQIDIHGDISRAMKEAQRKLDGKDIKGEIDRAMKEVQRELDSKDIKGEISRALKQAQIEMDRQDIKGEITRAMKDAHIEMGRAMKEAHFEIDRAMKESSQEMDRAVKEMDQAIKELDKEMKSDRESDGRYGNVSRDALTIAKRALEHSRDAMKKSMAAAKSRKN
jgi:hypothetical protein